MRSLNALCSSRSALPTRSCRFPAPASPASWRTSSPIPVNSRISRSTQELCSPGVKFFKPSFCASSVDWIWVVMPAWQVPSLHLRQMVQPIATIAMLAKPTRFAPSSTILTTSSPVFMPPSHQISTLLRMPASTRARCAWTTPISAGRPTY